jgi:microcystin-dependent protein
LTKVRARARILERSITSGSGPWSLAGAVDDSYNTFSSFLADGDSCYGSVVEPGVAFATGWLTYHSSGNTIELTDPEEAKGTFGSGTKEIFAGPLASSNMLREDIAGAIVTGGTSTAYTVASHRVYDTLAHLDGAVVAFTMHTTNAAGPVTLSVDGLTAKPLRPLPGSDLLAGVLIAGTPYSVVYNNAAGEFYLHGLFGNPFNVPLAGGMDFWGSTVPNSCFAFPIGQAISRTTYAALFAIMGTTYGAGDGSTTFNLPDKTGRVSAMKEASPSRLTSSFFGGNSANLGAVGGNQSHTLVAGEIPSITSAVSTSGTLNGATTNGNLSFGATPETTGGGAFGFNSVAGTGNANVTVSGSMSGSSTSNNTGGAAHAIVQPTIICNYIMRVI